MRLWTPTDWDYEADLRKRYISWLVEQNELPCFYHMYLEMGILSRIPWTPEDIIRCFQQTGTMYVDSVESDVPPVQKVTFEWWRENIYGGLTSEEEEEMSRLRELRKDHTRWFSQQEWDRLAYLSGKRALSAGSPHKVT
jgi:hypothetical protein